MSAATRPAACLVAMLAVAPAAAAGGGAGAGGAGSQRAINSGLPPGEPGPPGSPNNRGGQASPPAPMQGSPRPEVEGGAPRPATR